MSKKLNNKEWSEIEARYKSGDKIREIARDFDIPHGTIQARIKRDGWTQEIATKLTEIQEKITEISQVAKNEDLAIIEAKIHESAANQFAIISSIQNLDKGALSLHNIILKNTISKTKTGEMNEREASGIVAQMGLSVDKVASRAGIGKESPTTAIQINSTHAEVTMPANAIDASHAYQELINGSK